MVLVTLRSSFQPGDDHSYSGVITIEVSDPEMASMDPEEILQHIRLNPESICWAKRWDDISLQMDAKTKAQEEARKALEWLSEIDMELLAGEPQLTRESLLHLTIKRIVQEAGFIVTPEFIRPWPYDLPNGEHATLKVKVNWGQGNLHNVRLEQRMPGLVPDVLCDINAWRTRRSPKPLRASSPSRWTT